MSYLEVEAFLYEQKIGTLLLRDGIVYFEYDKQFKQSNLEISPLKLPLSHEGVYTNNDDKYFEGLAGVFHDTLPDKFGTKVIERYFESKGITPEKLNILQKLMFVADKSIGAISYKPVIETSNNFSQNLIELNQFYNNAKKIVSGDTIEVIDEMLTFMDSAASAGGARAKAIVGFNSQNNQLISSVNNNLPKGYDHYLLKFDMEKDNESSSDYTKIEYLYMTMAKDLGITIPDVKLLNHGKLSHYLIKRFDRLENGKKIHSHTVAGLTHSNFNIPMHYSYDQLLKLTRYLTGSQQAVIEQYKRMIFNIVFRNQDDHAKNFSFMMDINGKWDITPAYDITYANGTGYTKNHQLSIKGKTDNFTKEDFISLATLHSIKKQDALIILNKTIDMASSFTDKAKDLNINIDTINKINRNLRINFKSL